MTSDDKAMTSAARQPSTSDWTSQRLEQEAIRGDRVLCRAIVVIAFLFGCTEIDDARTLVHVRSGEWLIAHGFWPPASDPFSITTAGRHWINLSWGFDLLSALLYRLGGATLFSLLQGAAAAAVAAMLLACARPGIRNWGGSLCVALTILTVYPDFVWRPELITLLGTTALLWSLIQFERADIARLPFWSIPAGLWVWTQLDPRAWIGGCLLLLYALGQWISSPSRAHSAVSARVPWGWIAGASLFVMLLNPFGWASWLAPWQLYAVEYPTLRDFYAHPWGADLEWYSLASGEVWTNPDHRLVAGLLLQLLALAGLRLNRSRAPAACWLLWLGATCLSWFTLHELPSMTLVMCVIATTQLQEWYVARFGQVYSDDPGELLFSRGGRVLTLGGYFGMAWLMVSGQLGSPELHRFGLGLSCGLRYQLEDFLRLASAAPDDRSFHFTLRQGDALIAAGRRSYVDHRISLFAPQSGQAENLIALHNRARHALRGIASRLSDSAPSTSSDGEQQLIAEAFDRFEISHVLPRLNQNRKPPDYLTFLSLLGSRMWTLSDVWPTVAVFLRADSPRPGLKQYARSRQLNVIQTGFHRNEDLKVAPRSRPQPPAAHWLFAAPVCPARGTQIAQHWLMLEHELPTAPLPFQMGTCLSAVRAAQAGVSETPESAASYRTLGALYSQLLRLESAVLANTSVSWGRSLRYFQAIAPLRQAAELDPDDPDVQLLLFEVCQGAGYADMTCDALTRYLALTADDEHETHQARRESLEQLRQRLSQVIAETQGHVRKSLAEQGDPVQLAFHCYRTGCLNLAIELLTPVDHFQDQPDIQWQLAHWLAERGEGTLLDQYAERLQILQQKMPSPRWREPVAYAALGRGDYAAAYDQWQEERAELELHRMTALLSTSALSLPMSQLSDSLPIPLFQFRRFAEPDARQATAISVTAWKQFICRLEAGQCDLARQELKRALNTAPESPLRPLFRLYWYCLTDELLDTGAAEDRIPDDPSMFVPEESPVPQEAFAPQKSLAPGETQ